jgi:hypothetical protein
MEYAWPLILYQVGVFASIYIVQDVFFGMSMFNLIILFILLVISYFIMLYVVKEFVIEKAKKKC